MSREIHLTIPFRNGLHARPACRLIQITDQFAVDIQLVNERTGYRANAKSILSLIAGDFRHKDPCRLVVGGNGEEPVQTLLSLLVTGESEVAEVATAPDQPSRQLPRYFLDNAFAHIYGAPIVSGIAEGKIEILKPVQSSCDSTSTVQSPEHEQTRLRTSLRKVREQLLESANRAKNTEKEIVLSHLAIASDVEFEQKILSTLKEPGIRATEAVMRASSSFIETLNRTENSLLKERGADIQDVCTLLVAAMCEVEAQKVLKNSCLSGPTILCAESLTPQQLLSLDRTHLRGLLLTKAGLTSHTIVLARAFGIPTVAGVPVASFPAIGSAAIVDGRLGVCVPNPSKDAAAFFSLEKAAFDRRRHANGSDAPATTLDGVKVRVEVNVIAAAELTPAVTTAMDSVGLFRTEMLFIGGTAAPTETEQFNEYRTALLAAAGKPVTFRLLDLGGDKVPEYLRDILCSCPERRGSGLYDLIQDLLRTQLRAILRASPCGNARILVPMVSDAEIVRRIRADIANVSLELQCIGVQIQQSLPVGAMVENIEAVQAIHSIAEEADFVSIGSNDLAQALHDFRREDENRWEAVGTSRLIQTIRDIVSAVHDCKKSVTICGEIAADEVPLRALIGSKIDGVSVPPSLLAQTRVTIGRSSSDKPNTTSERMPFMSSELVVLDSTSRNKAETLRELANLLFSTGRSNDPESIEAALWKREFQHSTDFDGGFAIPHCKSPAIEHSSVAIVRLAQPIKWDEKATTPVSVIVLLAMNDSCAPEQHLATFSRLARGLMKEEFRNELRTAACSNEILDCMRKHVGGVQLARHEETLC